MSQTDKKKDPESLMERHIHTVLLSIITAGIIGVAACIFSLSIGMAEVKITLDGLRESSKSYVTLQYMQERDKYRDQQLIEIDKRIGKVENKIERITP